jgi:hypothetical protein
VKGADHDEVRLRLDIMLSQIAVAAGRPGNFIHKSASGRRWSTLIRILQQLDSGLDTMTPAQIKQILPVLSEIDGPDLAFLHLAGAGY